MAKNLLFIEKNNAILCPIIHRDMVSQYQFNDKTTTEKFNVLSLLFQLSKFVCVSLFAISVNTQICPFSRWVGAPFHPQRFLQLIIYIWRADHDVAQLDHGRNMCAKFELLPAYSHRDLARTKWQPPPAHTPARPARMKTIPAQPWMAVG